MRRLLLVAATTHALDALHALIDAHPEGLRRVRVAPTSFGRGLVATCPLAAEEPCLRIPFDLCAIEADNEEGHWASRLASRLVRNELQSIHKASLPGPPDVLTRWPDESIDALGDPSLSSDCDATFFWRDAQWAAHLERHPGDDDRDRYIDALDLVCSRTVRCGTNLVLAPLLDMANHHATGCSYVCEGDSVALYTSRALAEGDEVCLDYGSRSNGDWLLHYGFLPPSNKDDVQSLGGPYSVSWGDPPLLDADLIVEAREALDAVQGDVGMLEDPRRNIINEYRSQRRRLLKAACGD
jgi:hypothetical protein